MPPPRSSLCREVWRAGEEGGTEHQKTRRQRSEDEEEEEGTHYWVLGSRVFAAMHGAVSEGVFSAVRGRLPASEVALYLPI